MVKVTFIQKLKELMKEKHVTGYRLSKTTDLSKSYIYKLLNGDPRAKPKISTLDEFAKGLHVSRQYMYNLARIERKEGEEPVVSSLFKDGHKVFRYQGREISESDWKIFEPILNRFSKDKSK